MRKALRIASRLAVVLVIIVAALAIWKREEISRLLAVNSLFAPDKIVANFSAMDGAFLGHVDKRDSHEGSGVIQAGIYYGDPLAPRPDERRGMVAV